MPHQILWYTQNKMAYAETIGRYSEDEFFVLMDEFRTEYLEDSAMPVNLICDMRHVSEYPRNILAIQKALKTAVKHPKMGWLVLVGQDEPFVRLLDNALAKLPHVKYLRAESLEEAELVLNNLDEQRAQSA